MNKPSKQTIVPFHAVAAMMGDLPLKKIRNFGGKVGTILEGLGCKTAADVQALNTAVLRQHFGASAACAPAL
jgi:nucleotidyltransferase/DNA polymerase involved in DNA repair